jgi:DNA-binding transcriptional LysR family regulator
MELKQLESFTNVVEYRSFTKAAEKLYISQPTISTHIRQLEEELHSRLIIRTTKSIEITAPGVGAVRVRLPHSAPAGQSAPALEGESRKIIRLGASTIPSAYILPECSPHMEGPPRHLFFHPSKRQPGIVDGLLQGNFGGLVGMRCADEALACIPFYQDRMVLITPVNEHFRR